MSEHLSATEYAMLEAGCVPGLTADVAKRLERLAKQRERRKARDEAMRSLGLVKVRGALGGVYWE
jgi:hypothetical protein